MPYVFPLPTRAALAVAAAFAVVALGGIWFASALNLLLFFDILLLLGVWFDALRAPQPAPYAITVERESAPTFTVGHESVVTYRWANQAHRTARLRVREVRPDILGGVLPPRILEIPAGAELVETSRVVPVSRGRAHGGAFVVESVGPWRLGRSRSQVPLPWEATVYPASPLRARHGAVSGVQRRREPGSAAARRLGEGRLFESLRDFVAGDDPRHIDWKATARRRKVIARQFQAERRQHVLLVLDCGRLLSAELAGRAALEYAVQGAVELAHAAIRQDDDVGVMAFSDGVHHYVPPQRGRRALREIMDVLARVEPHLVESDYPGAFRYLAVRNRKRALTVVFTDVIDRFASDALVANVASLRPRHLPLAVTLRNPDLDRAAFHLPRDRHDAFQIAAALELLRARGEALLHMRRAGVMVLDVPPARAAQAAAAQYLELKRRGRL
ncbi:MAG TPA: DUF58 domain-containing protein [Gemmatimonadales bacterium]|nr:DUF58 domain-containing protein [Gemmatimonadales bacterium]